MLFMACYKVGFWQVFAVLLIKNHLRTQDNHYNPEQKVSTSNPLHFPHTSVMRQ